MKHVLELKTKQIQQKKLEAEAERQSIVERAHAAAEASKIQTLADVDRRKAMADAEAYATRVTAAGRLREARARGPPRHGQPAAHSEDVRGPHLRPRAGDPHALDRRRAVHRRGRSSASPTASRRWLRLPRPPSRPPPRRARATEPQPRKENAMKEFARIFVPRFALAILLSLGFALSCAVAHGEVPMEPAARTSSSRRARPCCARRPRRAAASSPSSRRARA